MSEENAWKEKYLNDTRTTGEIIDLALKAGDSDNGWTRWDLIQVLHCRANKEVFEVAKRLCADANPKERELGANILGKLGDSEKKFPNESLVVLLDAIRNETDDKALTAAVYAVGHSNDTRALETLIKLKNYPNERIRYAVVHGLLHREDKEAIDTLIELSQDEDEDVRNWATYGLGTGIDVDTPEIREALFQRLNEKGDVTLDEIRSEALVGLARRKDERVFEPLLKELQQEDAMGLEGDNTYLVLKAAEEFADSRLLPALFRLKDLWGEDGDLLDDIIAACQGKIE